MAWKDKWNAAKREMDGAGIDTKLFKSDFGSALDAAEKANKAYRDVSGKDPKKTQAAGDTRKKTFASAKAIGEEYGRNIKYLLNHATDPKQKTALDHTATALMQVLLPLRG